MSHSREEAICRVRDALGEVFDPRTNRTLAKNVHHTKKIVAAISGNQCRQGHSSGCFAAAEESGLSRKQTVTAPERLISHFGIDGIPILGIMAA